MVSFTFDYVLSGFRAVIFIMDYLSWTRIFFAKLSLQKNSWTEFHQTVKCAVRVHVQLRLGSGMLALNCGQVKSDRILANSQSFSVEFTMNLSVHVKDNFIQTSRYCIHATISYVFHWPCLRKTLFLREYNRVEDRIECCHSCFCYLGFPHLLRQKHFVV